MKTYRFRSVKAIQVFFPISSYGIRKHRQCRVMLLLKRTWYFTLQNLIMIISIYRNIVTRDRHFTVSSQIWCVGKHRWVRAAWDTRENRNLQVHCCRESSCTGTFMGPLSSDVLLSLGAGKVPPYPKYLTPAENCCSPTAISSCHSVPSKWKSHLFLPSFLDDSG